MQHDPKQRLLVRDHIVEGNAVLTYHDGPFFQSLVTIRRTGGFFYLPGSVHQSILFRLRMSETVCNDLYRIHTLIFMSQREFDAFEHLLIDPLLKDGRFHVVIQIFHDRERTADDLFIR